MEGEAAKLLLIFQSKTFVQVQAYDQKEVPVGLQNIISQFQHVT